MFLNRFMGYRFVLKALNIKEDSLKRFQTG